MVLTNPSTLGKGHRYLTVVLDLKTGAIVFIGDGKGADALEPFWKRLRSAKTRIEAVAIDMSPAYINAVMSHLNKKKIVFDHFHVIKLFNGLSELASVAPLTRLQHSPGHRRGENSAPSAGQAAQVHLYRGDVLHGAQDDRGVCLAAFADLSEKLREN